MSVKWPCIRRHILLVVRRQSCGADTLRPVRRDFIDVIRRPCTWACIYVALIPLYATLYTGLPAGSFYDSNIQRESAFSKDYDSLRASLAAWIGAETTLTWRQDRDTFRMLTTSLQVGSVADRPFVDYVPPTQEQEHNPVYLKHHLNQGFSMEVRGLAAVRGQGINSNEGFDFFVLAQNPLNDICTARDRSQFVRYGVGYVNSNGTSPPLERTPHSFPAVSVLFPESAACGARSQLSYPRSDGGRLAVPIALNQQLYNYFKAERGDPAYASHLWPRMFYLSATTIATLGLGDITPVSDVARILVGLEAVMGILTIGLFLNALAWRWSRLHKTL